MILPSSLFPRVMQLSADMGAREIIRESGTPVVLVEMGEAACHDVNTLADILTAGGEVSR